MLHPSLSLSLYIYIYIYIYLYIYIYVLHIHIYIYIYAEGTPPEASVAAARLLRGDLVDLVDINDPGGGVNMINKYMCVYTHVYIYIYIYIYTRILLLHTYMHV